MTSTTRRRISRTSTGSSSIAGCRASTISAGSRRRKPMSMAASRWRCRSSMPARATSAKSSPSCCSGSGRKRSCSVPTMRSGRRAGWSRSSGRIEIPEDIAKERGVQLTDEIKEKILGLNAARLYDIDIEAKKQAFVAVSLQHRGGVAAMTAAGVLRQSPERTLAAPGRGQRSGTRRARHRDGFRRAGRSGRRRQRGGRISACRPIGARRTSPSSCSMASGRRSTICPGRRPIG